MVKRSICPAANRRCWLRYYKSQGHILSAEQLQDSLYGLGDGVESNAINVHIYNLRRKVRC